MPRNRKFEGDMMAIGRVRTPPFCRLPDIHRLFAGRYERFERLRPTSPVADYIGFLAGVARAQHETAAKFAACLPVAVAGTAAACDGAPLDRQQISALPLFQAVMDDFFTRMQQADLNEPSGRALAEVRKAPSRRAACALHLVSGSAVAENLAQHVFVMASLQVLMTLATRTLAAEKLRPLQGNRCPACGGTHSAAMIAGWSEAEGARFCSCLYCGTLWHHVRIKCTFCDATGGIEYREIAGGPGSILAETCKSCGRYCKQVNHQKDMSVDVFADDIGSIALDLLLRDSGRFRRGAFNPYMAGY